jgi:predicted MFS family arabinose efflux permease
MTRRPVLVLGLLTLVSFANYVDRMVLPALAQPIKSEFSLTDAQLGLLTGFAFVLLYSVVGVPLARLADRTNRAVVLAAALALWSLATAACGLTASFAGLVIARIFVGIGESGCQPIGYGLLGDYFPIERRALAMGWFMVGNSLGITAGFAIGGWIGALYGWRAAFVVVGLPGVLLALAVATLLRTPTHSQSAAVRSTAPPLLASLRLLLQDRRYRWLLAINGVYSYLIFGPISWLPAYFTRTLGLPLRTVGTWTGLTVGIGMGGGMLLGGVIADRLQRRSASAPQWFGGCASLVTAAAWVAVVLMPQALSAFVATFCAAAVAALNAPINVASVQNVCDPRLRATAASLASLATSLFGIGLAPLVIGLLSDAFTPTLGKESLRYAIIASLPVCFLAAALYVRLARLLREPQAQTLPRIAASSTP